MKNEGSTATSMATWIQPLALSILENKARECALSVTLGESCFNRKPFEILVHQIRNGVSKELKRGETPGRTGGSMIPLFVGIR